MSKKLTIVIPAPDMNKEIVELYMSALEKNWTDCPYDIVWVNEEETLNNSRVLIINCGKNATFCERIATALRQIDSKYILLTMEDFVISNSVNTFNIEQLLECMEEYSYVFCKIGPSKLYKNAETNQKYSWIKISQNNLSYGLSINCGLFEKQYLENLIKDEKWGPWDFENFCLYLAQRGMLNGCVYDSRDILHIVHLISKGKIIRAGERKLIRNGILVSLGDKWNRQSIYEGIRDKVFSIMEIVIPQKNRKLAKSIAKKIGIKTSSRY